MENITDKNIECNGVVPIVIRSFASMTKNVAEFLIRRAWIIGYIDAYGAIHSLCVDCEKAKCHGDYFPMQIHKRWRWSFSDSLSDESIYGGAKEIDHAEFEDIRYHLTKRYRIKWARNGYHDIEYLQSFLANK